MAKTIDNKALYDFAMAQEKKLGNDEITLPGVRGRLTGEDSSTPLRAEASGASLRNDAGSRSLSQPAAASSLSQRAPGAGRATQQALYDFAMAQEKKLGNDEITLEGVRGRLTAPGAGNTSSVSSADSFPSRGSQGAGAASQTAPESEFGEFKLKIMGMTNAGAYNAALKLIDQEEARTSTAMTAGDAEALRGYVRSAAERSGQPISDRDLAPYISTYLDPTLKDREAWLRGLSLSQAEKAKIRAAAEQAQPEDAYSGARTEFKNRQAELAAEQQIIQQQQEAKTQAYGALTLRPDFMEMSGFESKKRREAKINPTTAMYLDTGYDNSDDLLYDYINGDKDAERILAVNDAKSYTTHEGWKNQPEEIKRIFNYLYSTDGPEAATEFMNFAADKGSTGMEALYYGMMQGSGAISVAAALGSAVDKEGTKEAYDEFKSEAARVGQQHKALYTAGNIAGSVAMMTAISKGLGAIKGLSGLSALARGMITSGATRAASAAISGAGDVATGAVTPGKYIADIAYSGATGAAGGAVSGGIGSLGNFLTKNGLPNNRITRSVFSGLSSAGYTATSTGLGELKKYMEYPEGYKPDADQIIKDAIVYFAFGFINNMIHDTTPLINRSAKGAEQSGSDPSQFAGSEVNSRTYKPDYFDGMTQKQAKAEYRRLVKLYHTDWHPGDAQAEEYIKEINDAWNRFKNLSNTASDYKTATTAKGPEAQTAAQAYAEKVEAIALMLESGMPAEPEAADALQVLQAAAETLTANKYEYQQQPYIPEGAMETMRQTAQGLSLPSLEGPRATDNATPEGLTEHISMEDFANTQSPVWNNVPYDDKNTQTDIMRRTHNDMINEGRIIVIPENDLKAISNYYPDLRATKKSERVPVLKLKIQELKSTIRQYLSGVKGSYEFEVNGKLLEARLYDTGIKEVLKNITQTKASALLSSGEIFRNARYLYSTPDYDGDPNIYRWNYFYSPVKIGDDIVGVRIAIRDMANPAESQIYHWGIKENASLSGAGRGQNRISGGASSDALSDIALAATSDVDNSIPQNRTDVNTSYADNPTNMPEGSVNGGARNVFEAMRQQIPGQAGAEVRNNMLWTAPKDNGGWKEYYNGDIPIYDALKITDPELFDAFLAEAEPGAQSGDMPVTNAYIAAWEDVRQGTISPMAAAQLLSRAYKAGGTKAVNSLYNPATGNLYRKALNAAKAIDAEHNAPQTAPETVGEAVQRQLTGEEERIATAAVPPRNDNMNGGMGNGREEIAGAQSAGVGAGAAAESENAVGGRGALYGGDAGGRPYLPDRGSAGRVRGNTKENRTLTAQRQKAVQDQPFVSAADLGAKNGSEAATLRVLPESDYDAEAKTVTELAYRLGIKDVKLVVGLLQTETKAGPVSVDDISNRTSGTLIIRADSLKRSLTEIAEHSFAHFIAKPENVESFMQAVKSGYKESAWSALYDKYKAKWAELTNDYAGMTESEAELYVWEEILGDAYASINNYGMRASVYHGEAVRALGTAGLISGAAERAGDIALPAGVQRGAQGIRGPPERYLYAGRNADGFDTEALDNAERLEMQGLDPETIRQQTGLHRGADGLWRFEIDDSGMQYRRQGDMWYMEDPEYREYLDLWDKVVARGEGSDGDMERLRELDKAYSSVGLMTAFRLNEGKAKLRDIIKHDELFRNYPQLRDTKVQFAYLPRGASAQYNEIRNSITLDDSLRNAPEDTLIHEIQHVIQHTEGFAGGSSPDYWRREGRERVLSAENDLQQAISEFKQKQAADPYVQEIGQKLKNKEITPDQCIKLLDEYYNSVPEYTEMENLIEQRIKELIRYKDANPYELYKNTAGEIEARDAASRRSMTPEQRRETRPDTGDENTVFADDGEDSFIWRSAAMIC